MLETIFEEMGGVLWAVPEIDTSEILGAICSVALLFLKQAIAIIRNKNYSALRFA